MSPPTDAGPAVDSGYVPVDGTELYYRAAGSGPHVVFVHAGITDHRLWDHQFAALAADYRVVAYDLRGYGRSELPPEPYAHHEDLLGLFDALDIDRAHVVGASMGAATAVDFALEQPDRVLSLCLVGPAIGGYAFDDPATRDGWAAAGEAFERADWEQAATIESELWLAGVGRDLDDVDPALCDLVRTMLRRSYELDDDRATERELDPPAVARLDELAVPLLLVSGEYERPDIVGVVQLLESRLDDVSSHLLADTAHLPPLERPAAVTDLLQSFLAGVVAR